MLKITLDDPGGIEFVNIKPTNMGGISIEIFDTPDYHVLQICELNFGRMLTNALTKFLINKQNDKGVSE